VIIGVFFVLVFWGIPIWGVVDAALKPDPVWAAAGQNKILWVALQVILGIIGTAIYFFAVRPKLSPPAAG
jgi:hypothetical protein